jgi:spore coat protein U-like protein
LIDHRHPTAVISLVAAVLFLTFGPIGAPAAQDIFRLAAPPGAIYGNASFEQSTEAAISISVEHEGTAVPAWFLGATAGGGSYSARILSRTSPAAQLSYQLYPSIPDGTTPVLASPGAPGFSAANVITSGDFASDAAVARTETYTVYFEIPSGQFRPSGTYTDTVELQLYRGDPGDPGTHVLADFATVTVSARMARLVDLFVIQEPGIRTMDLTISVVDRLIATVHERSNADTGYEVRVTSANLAAAAPGPSTPFFVEDGGSGTLPYSVSFGGVPATSWINGTTVVTSASDTAGPDWVTRDLRISYSGSPLLPAGDYEDRLIIAIAAQ